MNKFQHSVSIKSDRLIVVNYEGARFTTGNMQNIKNNFFRDCGLYPNDILDQKNKGFIIKYFQNYTIESNKLIIHIKSHGFDTGICELHPEIENSGLLDTLITWQELIILFNGLSNSCNDLIVNLGTVCNSERIKSCKMHMNFDVLVTKSAVTNPVLPRKLNKELLLNIDNIIVNDGYELIRKK